VVVLEEGSRVRSKLLWRDSAEEQEAVRVLKQIGLESLVPRRRVLRALPLAENC
jgi:hypothetical protein